MDEIVLFGGLLLPILFGPWILLWRSRVRRRRERAEDQHKLGSLTERVFRLEQTVAELVRANRAQATQPGAGPPSESPAPATAPAPARMEAPEPAMGASQTAAQSWIRETATRQHPAPMEPLTPPLAAASSPPPPPLHAPAEPSLTSQTKSALRSALDLEEVLGTNWLNKIGVSILVLGIASFLAYQIRTLGPPGKVLAGYLAGSVMLGAGIWFERLDRYRILARAGVGGGWALLFFVTYAMYHVSAARVLSSQTTDLVLMLAVASAMVWHTLHYRSQVVTGLAFLLAFLTVTISHETVYSLTAGTVLAAALAVIAVRMRWFDLEAAGIAGTYLNHFLWLRPIIEPMHGKHRMFPEFFASAAILVAYWVIYRASYLCRRPDNARQENVSAAAALLNTAALLGLLKYQSVHPEWAFWALLAIGGVETALGQLPMARRRRTAAVVLSTLGAVLLIAAFPFRYSAARLSMLWLAEAEAMFLIGVWVREVVFRRVGLLAVATVAWQMLGVDAARVCGMRFDGAYVHSDPALAILFLVATVIFYLDAHWVLPRFPELFRAEFDRIVAERFSYAGFVLGLTGAWIAFPAAWTAVAWCALALLMGVAGERLRIPHLGYQGKLLAAAAALRAAAANFGATGKLYGVTQRLITVALVSLLLYVTTRLKIDDRGGKLTIGSSAFAYTDVVSGFCSWAASLLLSLLAWYELRAVSVAVAWAIGGLALLELGVARRSVALRFQGHALMIVSFLRVFFVNLNADGLPGEISPRFYTVVPVALALFYAYWRLDQAAEEVSEARTSSEIACYLGTITIAALVRFELPADWVAAAWAALVFATSLLAWRSRRTIFLHQSLLISFGVLFRVVLHNFYQRSYFPAPPWDDRRLSVGAAVLLLFGSLPFAFRLRKKHTRSGPGQIAALHALARRPEQVFFFIAISVLTVLLTLETRRGMITLAWGLEAVAVFMFALWAGERSFRLTGVALLLLCVGKILVVDVWRLHPRDRYMTLIVLGAALLLVSFMYTRYREAIRQYL